MKKFDEIFFKKYVSEGSEVIDIIHKHFIVIINKILINYIFFVILPSFIYHISDTIKFYIPFIFFEIFIIIIFIKNFLDILYWYNNVWIITTEGVIDLNWWLFEVNMVSLKYSNIEGLQVIETGFIDTVLNKGDIIINKIGGGGQFLLKGSYNPTNAKGIIDKYQKIYLEQKDNNFSIILDTLSGVVSEYLGDKGMDFKGIKTKNKTSDFLEKMRNKKGTIDLTKND